MLEFTASTISSSLDLLPRKPEHIILCGGGQFNSQLVKKLKEYIRTKIFLSNDLNLHGQYIEAELFAYLAARSYNNLAITFPSTTGVNKPMNGGVTFFPNT